MACHVCITLLSTVSHPVFFLPISRHFFLFLPPISAQVEGDEWRKASTDVVIAGLGWISITGEYVRVNRIHNELRFLRRGEGMRLKKRTVKDERGGEREGD